MIFIITAIIISIAVVISFAKSDDWEGIGWGIGILAGFGVLLISLSISCGIACTIGENYYSNNVEMKSALKEEYSLIALEDNHKAYVYRNSSSDKLEYTFMYKTPKGYRTKTISDIYVYIIEIPEDETPMVKRFENKFASFWKNSIALCPNETFIYVPKGTIVENINIDLE